jgi:hypothetical protein
MTRARLTVFSLALLAAAPAFAQTTVSGDWDVTIQSPQGANTTLVTLKQDGEKVSGIFKSPQGQLPFDGGTLTGSDLKFTFTITTQGMQIPITLTGKVEGATITGKADFGGFAEGDWSATRSEAAATASAATPAPAAAPATPAPSAATAGGAAGQWDVTFKTPGGDIAASATITEEGGKVAGTLASQMGETAISGTLEGKSLKLAFTAQTPQGSMPVTLTGDIDGDSILNGKADIVGVGMMEWTAKRKQ